MMWTTRRLPALFLSLALLLSLLPVSAAADGCNHTDSADTTLVPVPVTDDAAVNCQEVYVKQAHMQCSSCELRFTGYADSPEGKENLITVEADYVIKPQTNDHNWETGYRSSCSNTVNGKPCTELCYHEQYTNGVCDTCKYACNHTREDGSSACVNGVCEFCDANVTDIAPSITSFTASLNGLNLTLTWTVDGGTGASAATPAGCKYSFVIYGSDNEVFDNGGEISPPTNDFQITDGPNGSKIWTYSDWYSLPKQPSEGETYTVETTVAYGEDKTLTESATFTYGKEEQVLPSISDVTYNAASGTLRWLPVLPEIPDPAFKVTLYDANKQVVRNSEDLPAEKDPDSYFSASYRPEGITFGGNQAYIIEVALSSNPEVCGSVTVPAGASGPADVQPSAVSYDYASGALSWTIPAANAGQGVNTHFLVWIKKDGQILPECTREAYIADISAGNNLPVTVSQDGTAFSTTYKPVLAPGSYAVHVLNNRAGNVGTEIPFTVPNDGPGPSDEQIEEAIGNLDTRGDTPEQVTDKIKDIVGAESDGDLAAAIEDASDRTASAIVSAYIQCGMQVTGVPAGSAETVSNKTLALAVLNAPSGVRSVQVVKSSSTRNDHDTPSEFANGVSFSVDIQYDGAPCSRLSIPILVTWKIPASFRSDSTLKVLHYSGASAYEQLDASRDGNGNALFYCSHFSDFQLVELASTPGTPGSSGNTPHKGGSSGGGSSAKPANSTPAASGGNTVVTTAPAQVFHDIPSTHWAAAQIKWAYDNKCMNGTGDGAFSPNGSITRQALWMVLARLAGQEPADMSAAKSWAVEAGISDGSSPSGAVSRQQMVAILYRFAQMMEKPAGPAAELSSYPDAASVASYARDALAWAVGSGIVNGTSDGRLNPEGTATRAQFAVILYRFYNGE